MYGGWGIWMHHRGVTCLYNMSWLPPMQISSGGIGKGRYQEGKGEWRIPGRNYALKNVVSRHEDALLTLNIRTQRQGLYMLCIKMLYRWLSLRVLASPLQNTPLENVPVSWCAVGSVILLPCPVFFGALAKGCECDDGAAAEERGCNVLPEWRILQKLHFTAC